MQGSSLRSKIKRLQRAYRPLPHPDLSVPAYSYCFIKGGHSRDFMTWVMLRNLQLHTDVQEMRRVVHLICLHMAVTPMRAGQILRAGNGLFWDFWPGEPFMELRSRRHIHLLIKQNLLAPMRKTSIYAMPWRDLRDLARMHAYMSFPVQSASEESGTARAYAGKAIGANRATISRYRKVLREAKMIASQRRFTRRWQREDGETLASGEFPHRNNPQLRLRRRTDVIYLNLQKIKAPYKTLCLRYAKNKLTGKPRFPRPLEFSEHKFFPVPPEFTLFEPTIFPSGVDFERFTEQSSKEGFRRRDGPIQQLRNYVDPDGFEDFAQLPPIDPRAKPAKRRRTVTQELAILDGDPVTLLDLVMPATHWQETPAEQEAQV